MFDSPGMTAGAIAVNRFGLGARPGEPPPTDAKAWLRAQLERYEAASPPWRAQPDTTVLAAEFDRLRRAVREQRGTDNDATRKALGQWVRDTYRSAVDARVESALNSPTPFVERLVHFWANHFAVSVEKPAVAALAGAFEAEAIRPHVLGRFDDLLVAVERHPAMQIYLDQVRSIGPDSPAAERAAARNPSIRRGLNENLAREIMELHTLGVRTGYEQSDVTEFARALTGWSIIAGDGPAGAGATQPVPMQVRPAPGQTPVTQAQIQGAAAGRFVFRPALHEPGVRTIMGRRYDQPGEQQALAILQDLAVAPATATHIATKLARHFVRDTPPPSLVVRLADVFARSGGDLPSVYRVLIDAPEAWSPAPAKFKTPWEWSVSSLRALGFTDLGQMRAAPLLTQLGQPVWRPGSPAGYDDVAASWAAPDALVRRVELAQRFAARTGGLVDGADARTLAPQVLAGSLSDATATAIGRAESAPTALALLLVSPDFQRR